MSNYILTPAWKLKGISPSQKLVLISLADQANDDGACWPSVSTIENRTCLSERTIQSSIKSLEKLGFISRHERAGRSTYYTVNVAEINRCNSRTPANAAPVPPQMPHPTPANAAPITIIEPSIEPSIIVHDDKSHSQVCSLITNQQNVTFPIYANDIELWTETYPAVDIPQEIRKIMAWLDANPKQRKTKSGMKRFVNSWLSRAQDKPRQRATSEGRVNVISDFLKDDDFDFNPK